MESVFFLGACTPQGFVSHYDSLFSELQELTILKGGCGCGKSTFLRAVGRAARERGLDVCEILCSSDPDSLDAIILPSLSVGFADGTAPHVLEPPLCGGRVNYLNFGEYYDRAAMQTEEAEIRAVQAENAAQYRLVTACLAAADKLSDCVRLNTGTPRCDTQTDALAECLAMATLTRREGTPFLRRRFLNAITPKGLKTCAQTPAALCEKLYVLRDNYGLAPHLLSVLQQRATENGHDCVACYSPLLPHAQPTHLLLPTAGIGFVSDSTDFPFDEPYFCRFDLDSMLSSGTRRSLAFCQKTKTALLYQAVSYLREAKRLHDCMETLCRPYVDFEKVSRRTARVIAALFVEK